MARWTTKTAIRVGDYAESFKFKNKFGLRKSPLPSIEGLFYYVRVTGKNPTNSSSKVFADAPEEGRLHIVVVKAPPIGACVNSFPRS